MSQIKLRPSGFKAERPRLGGLVEFDGIAYKNADYTGRNVVKHWQIEPCKLTTGVYIGWRTVSEGAVRTVGDDFDSESIYTPSRFLEVWLVVVNERKNPLHVFPQSIPFNLRGRILSNL